MVELFGQIEPIPTIDGSVEKIPMAVVTGVVPIPSTAKVGQILSVLSVDDEMKLTAVEAIDKPETPSFDLASAGLPAITLNGVPVELETDTTDILAAVSKGAVVFKLNANFGGEVITANIVGTCICSNIGEETASVICPFVMDELGFVLLSVYPQRIEAVYMPHSMIAGSSGGVSSWNDLTDKPFGDAGGEVELFPETTVTFTFDNGTGTLSAPAMFELVEGETYRVVVDGSSHEIVCVNEGGDLLLPHLVQDTSTGDFTDGTFVIAYTPADPDSGEAATMVAMIVDSTSTPNHTFALYQCGEVKTLDAKYLPMDAIDARIDAKSAVATGIDLSAYESNGTIVETFADGSSKTTTVEFDANGNPVKITDGDGNVITIAW